MQKKPFGKLPSGPRLERIIKSPQYKGDGFQNILETPMLADDISYFRMFKEYFFMDDERRPTHILPSLRTDLKTIPDGEPALVWFGHSSYFLRIEGKNILVDPV